METKLVPLLETLSKNVTRWSMVIRSSGLAVVLNHGSLSRPLVSAIAGTKDLIST
jgi:hypothetical protein